MEKNLKETSILRAAENSEIKSTEVENSEDIGIEDASFQEGALRAEGQESLSISPSSIDAFANDQDLHSTGGKSEQILSNHNMPDIHPTIVSARFPESDMWRKTRVLKASIAVSNPYGDRKCDILNCAATDNVIVGKDNSAEIYMSLYNSIRSNDVQLFEFEIGQWKVTNIDFLLSKVYEEIRLINLPLSREMEFSVETKLIDARFFCEDNFQNVAENFSSLDIIVRRVQMVCALMDELCQKPVNAEFMLIARFIAQNIHILKQKLRSTYDMLPWEEIEFCLSIFISSNIKQQEFNVVYRIILDKEKFFKHLQDFVGILKNYKFSESDVDSEFPMHVNKKFLTRKEIVQSVKSTWKHSSGESLFEELYNDYDIVRSVFSLKRIESYIKLAVSINLEKKEELGKLVIERTLQVIGESLKNTVMTPNVPEEILTMLLYTLPSNVGETISQLRDHLSHANTLTSQMKMESAENVSHFGAIQNDLRKLEVEICNILYKKNIDAITLPLNKIIESKNLEDIRKIVKNLHSAKLGKLYLENDNSRELDTIKKLVHELSDESDSWNNTEKQLLHKIVKLVDSQETKLTDIKTKFSKTFTEMGDLLNFIYHCKSFETIRNRSRDCLNRMMFQESSGNFVDIVHLAITINNSIFDRTQDKESYKISFLVAKICSAIKYQAERINGINEYKERLELKEEIKAQAKALQEIKNMFFLICEKLGDDSSRHSFQEAITGIRTIYEVKVELDTIFNQLINGEATEEAKSYQINDLLNKLNLRKNKKVELGKQIKDTKKGKWQKCKSLIYEIRNGYQTLLNSVINSLDSGTQDFTKALKNFANSLTISPVLLDQINKAIDDVITERKQMLEICFDHRLEMLKCLIKSNANIIEIAEESSHRKYLQAAIEMIVLDLTKILGDSSHLRENKMFLDSYSPILAGKSLRNYLAHGDILIDIQPLNPSRAIFINAQKFASLVHLGNKQIGRQEAENLFYLNERYKQNLEIITCQYKMFLAAREGDIATIQDCINNGADTHARSNNGWTGLHYATAGDSLINVKFFLAQNLIIDAKDISGKNPLRIAALMGSSNVMQYFLKEKQLNANEITCEQTRKTLLHDAAECVHADVVNVLLENNANFDATTNNGWTPLHMAALKGCTNIVNMLLQKGANVFATLKEDSSLLHLAAQEGHKDLITFLLKNVSCIGLDSQDKNKDTPLHMAALFNHHSVVCVLIEAGANLEAKDDNDCTPLHKAAITGDKNIAKLLLENGAHCDALNNNKFTPLHVAALEENYEVTELLLSKSDINAQSLTEDTPLHLAAAMGALRITQLLLENGANVNAQNKARWTPLHWAAGRGHTCIVEMLLKFEAIVDATNENGFAPIFFATQNGHAEIVDILCKKNANVHAVYNKNSTLLHWAAQNGHEDVTKVLLANGADANSLEDKRFMPLHTAVYQGHLDIVKVLIDNGAAVDCTNDLKWTPLHWAARQGHQHIVDLLLICEADVNLKNSSNDTPLHYAAFGGHQNVVHALIKNGAVVDVVNKDGWTPLHWAAGEGHIKAANELLKLNANVNCLSKDKESPLQFAVQNGHADVVRALLAKGGDGTVLSDDGWTLLHWAAARGHKDVAELLLENGIDVNVTSAFMEIPLHFAACEGHSEVVHVLLRKGAQVDSFAKNNKTPLNYAAINGHQKVVQILLEKCSTISVQDKNNSLYQAVEQGQHNVVNILLVNGADANFKESGNWTLLHIAAQRGHGEIVKILLEKDVNVNVLDKNDLTALHYAAYKGFLPIVRLLLEKDAAVDVVGINNVTPLHLACQNSHEDVVQLLLNENADHDIQDKKNGTALHIAARNSHIGVLTMLREKKASINPLNKNGETPLHFAAKETKLETVKWLIENDADVLARNDHETILHRIVQNKRLAITAYFIDKLKEKLNQDVLHQYINTADGEGNTPLLSTALLGNTSKAKMLLSCGASTSIQNIEGMTALHLSARRQDFEFVKLLVENQANVNIRDRNGNIPLDLLRNILPENNQNLENIQAIIDLLETE